MASVADRLRTALKAREMKQADLAKLTGINKSSISTYLSGAYEPKQDNIYKMAKALDVSEAWLMGHDVAIERRQSWSQFDDNMVTFPILGNVAAGYDHNAMVDWDGDLVNVPYDNLRGRPASDFFALRVSGDSMYPQYQDGDIVLVLRQSTLNRSGDVGVVLYNSEEASLKRIDFVMGEDWMRLVPINPNYSPVMIENEELEKCRVLGIPWMLIRYIEE